MVDWLQNGSARCLVVVCEGANLVKRPNFGMCNNYISRRDDIFEPVSLLRLVLNSFILNLLTSS